MLFGLETVRKLAWEGRAQRAPRFWRRRLFRAQILADLAAA